MLKGKISGQPKSERKRRRKVQCDSKIVALKEASHVPKNELCKLLYSTKKKQFDGNALRKLSYWR